MKTPFLWFLLPLGALAACQSPPVPPPMAARPGTLSTALVQAQTEVQAHRWGPAWVLVANRDEPSDQRAQFLGSVQTGLETQLAEARTKGDPRVVEDLEATLALMKTGHWDAPAPVATTPASTDPTKWLEGTATVFVDRGLQVQDGSAVPGIVLGSGFFISADGLLITNHHVIEAKVDPKEGIGAKLWVALPDAKGVKTPAKVVGWDRNLDLALLKVETKPPYVFSLSTLGDPDPGQRLQAIGSPGGLEQTLTSGIASAEKRPLLALGEVLQIDVPVNPGNSGGPLLDESGRVVGVVFAGIASFQGVNFAIPAALVQKELPRLKVGGAAVIPWMGLGLQEDAAGLEVGYVAPQSPGDWAGVQVGDRLTDVAGVPVTEIAAAQVRLLDFGTSAVIPLGILRNGKPLTVWTTLDPRPDFPLEIAAKKDLVARVLPLAFGAVVQPKNPGDDRVFTVTKTWAGSTADDLSLVEGDSIEVLRWDVNPKDHSLAAVWKLNRKNGKDPGAIIKMEMTTALHTFL